MNRVVQIYGGLEPRELPTYTYAEAGRHLRIPAVTLRSWVAGTTYRGGVFEPVIQRPDPDDPRLSFTNLIEAHVLRALRTRHGVPMRTVREALDEAESRYSVPRLLVRRELKAAPGRLFFDRYGQLTDLPKGEQLWLREAIVSHLDRLAYDREGELIRFFPWIPDPAMSGEPKKSVLITPVVSFGSPITTRRGIRTAVLAARYDSDETILELAQDYRLPEEDVEDAILYERAA